MTMIEMYALYFGELLQEPVEGYLRYFSRTRQEEILRYRFLADQNRTLWAELLVRWAAAKRLSRKVEELPVERDVNGKPYLRETGLHISISHSKNWTAVSLGEEPSGIDVEEPCPGVADLARNFFTASEYRRVSSISGEDGQTEEFLRMWTLKESYFKYTGDEECLQVDSKRISEDPRFNGRNVILPNRAVMGFCAGTAKEIEFYFAHWSGTVDFTVERQGGLEISRLT